jgi:hypothetical protein
MPKITFYPLGNADCCLIDLDSRRKLLFDYADMRCATDPDDLRIDLPTKLQEDLDSASRTSYDVVAFTHLDNDHICGASNFFYLEHAKKYQSEGRTRIAEIWVPAGVIIEEGCTDEARIIQAEARHRLRKGEGIRVFSRPAALEAWLKQENLSLASRSHLITDAGQLVPGFTREADGVEFFVHSPFASRLEDGSLFDRNTDALVLQATFVVDGVETKLLLAADAPHEVLSEIVRITKYHSREGRLAWDIFKLPHHCSYLSLGPEKGKEKTEPVPDVQWLFETQGQHAGIVVSTSKPIPSNDDDDQPPHRQAAAYHKGVVAGLGGRFIVTMEHPKESAPGPLLVTIDRFKATVKMRAGAVGGLATSAPAPRAGSSRLWWT